MSPNEKPVTKLVRQWRVPTSATFGSSVRSRGILLEILSRLPKESKKSLGISGGVLTLTMADNEGNFNVVVAIVSKVLDDIESLPVIPREIQDILSITVTERHRWLKDGRLQSAGTRTVRLRGRAKEVTFHIYNHRYIETLLDGELVATWREEDAARATEARLWGSKKRSRGLGNLNSTVKPTKGESPKEASRFKLKGWAEFERDGPCVDGALNAQPLLYSSEIVNVFGLKFELNPAPATNLKKPPIRGLF